MLVPFSRLTCNFLRASSTTIGVVRNVFKPLGKDSSLRENRSSVRSDNEENDECKQELNKRIPTIYPGVCGWEGVEWRLWVGATSADDEVGAGRNPRKVRPAKIWSSRAQQKA